MPLNLPTLLIICLSPLSALGNFPNFEELSKKEAATEANRLFGLARQTPSDELYDSLEYLINYFDIDSMRSQYYLSRGRFELLFNNNTRAALQFLTNARQISADDGDTSNELAAMVQIAQLYNHTSISDKSVELIMEIKQKAEEIQDSTRISAAYFLLAQANPNISDYNISMFKKSLEFYGNKGRNLPRILSNIGYGYMIIPEPNLDSALYYLSRANTLNDSMRVDPSAKNSLAEAYLMLQDFETADSLLDVALLELGTYGRPSLLPYTLKVRLLSEQGESGLDVLTYIDRGLEAIKSGYYDDYDIRDFCRESKSALYDVGDLAKIQLLDSIETSVQDSILHYIEEASVGIAESSYAIGELESAMAEKDQVIKTNRGVIVGLIGVLMAAAVGLVFFRRQQKLHGELKAQKEKSNKFSLKNQELEAQLFAQKIDQQERQLSSYVLSRVQQNETLEEVLNRMKVIKSREAGVKKQVGEVIGLLENNLQKEDHWDNFLIHFENIHPNFYAKLKDQYPDLSKQDRRILAYLKMELSSKEIAQLLAINYESVNTSRYRIRKKLGLPKDVELDDFVASI